MAYPAKVDVSYVKKASRVELFVRIVYGFILGIIAGIWGFFASIAIVLQWIYILLLGKRQPSLYNFTAGYWRFFSRTQAYVFLLTDSRPPITGDKA